VNRLECPRVRSAKYNDEKKMTYLIGVDKPLNRGCLKRPVAIWDNGCVLRFEVVGKDRLDATVQSGLLALLGVFQ
jgi:hypothetical protein